jgi:hydroxymethylglutaryl-CoA lyase
MSLSKKVEIVEVGPRDGLQNEAQFIPTHQKVKLIDALSQTGIKRIEATSFVHPEHVPQMKDAKEVIEQIKKADGVQYMALIPNEKGYRRAVESGVRDFAFVVGASNTFNLKNVRMNRDDSIRQFIGIIEQAKSDNFFIRCHIATSFWCPYEGKIDEKDVVSMVELFDELAIDEIVICDTIGKANPRQVRDLFDRILDLAPKSKITAHFHDTYGFGQANVFAALQAGVTSFDASIGGLGGCPFAPGAAGNISTEDLVYLLHQMGIETGIDLNKLLDCVNMVKMMTDRTLTGHIHHIQLS